MVPSSSVIVAERLTSSVSSGLVGLMPILLICGFLFVISSPVINTSSTSQYAEVPVPVPDEV